MELKLQLLVLFLTRVYSLAAAETEIVEENDQHLMDEALYNDDEDFLDDIDEDLDYFYTYEALKNLQTMIPKPANGSNANVDMAEKFFLNFLTEEEYEEGEDYSYEYEDATDDLVESEAKDSDFYNYTELDEIDHDDFVYFDTLEDFIGQSSAGSAPRDTVLMLILAAVVVVVMVFLLLLLFLRSRQSETDRSSRGEEEETQVGVDNLLKEIV